VKVTEFGAYVLVGRKWTFSTYTGKPFSGKDFADWYSCPDAMVRTGKEYSDPDNWTASAVLIAGKTRWYYIGVDRKGRRVKGEAISEEKGEIDRGGPKK
jgi:hypothetical protein